MSIASGLSLPVSGDSFVHALTAANAPGEISAPTAPYPVYLIYSLVSTVTNEFLSMNRLSSGPYMGAAPYPVESATGDNWTQLEGYNTAWDWVCIKLAIAMTGTIMMGRLTGGDGSGPIQALKLDPTGGLLTHVYNDEQSQLLVSVIGPIAITTTGTNFPVQLQDGASGPIPSTGGSLNVNVTNTNTPTPVTQSGTWSIGVTNTSIGTPGAAPPAQATMMGVHAAATGELAAHCSTTKATCV